ncbi:MAG: ATP synthase F1 subunit gamma [Spirochaetes bacterium RBG_13_51_14]|nr:MAG: ATP synthase F1 subunit gamma [Spirochaetes bacterium RBG_13_51_14]
MATQRDIKKRIQSVTNTRKITSTMEMVSTAKMQKMKQRLEMSKPYEHKLNEILSNLMSTGLAVSDDPHFNEVSDARYILILEITGNRGLCGSYNTNIIDRSFSFRDKLAEEGKDTQFYVVGKKAISYFNFMKVPMYKSMLNPENKLTFEDAAEIGNELSNLFLSGDFHEVHIAYTKVASSSSQKPTIIKLLPILLEEEEIKDLYPGSHLEYYFEPNPLEIFSYLIPQYLKMKIYTCFLESSFSEQFARRVAMKNASDASSEMIRDLTISYNRARQAKITKEISEIVGGAAALK